MNSKEIITLLSTARTLGLTSYPHLQTILHLGRVGTCRTMDLTTVCQVVPEAVTQVVDKLAKLGLVTRRHCTDDRRVIHLSLTPAGQATFNTIIQSATEPIRSPKPKIPRQKSKYDWHPKKKASPSQPVG